ncbi:MAG: winged helix-turn-helix domain-containing protein [Woeseiaceae bacterium]
MSYDITHGFELGSFTIEPLQGCVIGPDQEPRHLPPKAMEVLVNLAVYAPETVTRRQLLNKVWSGRYVSDEALTHAITELRHALEDDPRHPEYIETIPKRGYRLLKAVHPPEGSSPHQVGNDWSPGIPGWFRRRGGAKQRGLIIAALVLVSIAVGLTAIFDPPPGENVGPSGLPGENSTSVPSHTESRTETTDAPNDTESNALYLRAQSLAKLATPDHTSQAETLLKKAVSIESDNAPAWSLLGRVYYRQAELFRTRPVQEGYELARKAIQRALAIDPEYGPAHAELALIKIALDYDFDGALRHARRAQELSPADPHVLRTCASMEITHAHVDHAIELLERSVSLDPNSSLGYSSLGQAYFFARRLDDAEESLEASLLLNPSAVRSRYLLGLVQLAQGREGPALVTIGREADEGYRLIGTAIARHALGDTPASDEALQSARQTVSGAGPYELARAYAFRGQRDTALDWLELAYDSRDVELINLLLDPLLVELKSEARWSALVQKLDMPHQANPNSIAPGQQLHP